MMGLKKNKSELNYLKLNNQSKTITQALDKLIKFLCLHIKSQIDSGADVVQIFDSWAGLIPEEKD